MNDNALDRTFRRTPGYAMIHAARAPGDSLWRYRKNMMFGTRNWLAFILGACLTTSALAATEGQRPPVGERVLAFSGEQGLQVWTLRYGERSEQQALVQVGGIDHDWDKRIQKMQVEKTSKDTRYSTEVDGKPFVALIVRGNSGELYLPGEGRELPLHYDQALSEQGNAQYFLTDYLQQPAAK